MPAPHLNSVATRAGLKGGGPGQFSLEGPYDVFCDVIVCIIYDLADSQRPRFLFPVVDYAPALLTRLLAAFDCKPHEIVLKINQLKFPTFLHLMFKLRHCR